MTQVIDGISSYQNAITTHAAPLDDLHLQSTAVGLSATTSASLARAAALIIFNNKTITPQSSDYTAEKERNWSISLLLD